MALNLFFETMPASPFAPSRLCVKFQVKPSQTKPREIKGRTLPTRSDAGEGQSSVPFRRDELSFH